MPFKPGEGGRQPGALNRRSKDFLAILEKHDFCPASALIECYRDAKKTYDNYGVIYEAICDARISKNEADGSLGAPTEDNAHKYLKIAADVAKELSGYAYPKLKSVEQGKLDVTRDMTPEQRLEAMKHAVTMLEMQIQGNGHGTP